MSTARKKRPANLVVDAMHQEAGMLLRDTRNNLGLSLATVAEALQMAPEYLRLIEVGRRRPSDEDRLALARYYRMSPGDIWSLNGLNWSPHTPSSEQG